MIVWLILAVYVGLLIPTWRRTSWILAHDVGGYNPDGEDVAFGMFMGFLISCLWPIVLPLYFAHKHGALSSGGHAFLKEPELSRREREVEERERRIARLEFELGIGRADNVRRFSA